jgi:hypothetical protein
VVRPSVVDINGLYPFVVGLRKIVQQGAVMPSTWHR